MKPLFAALAGFALIGAVGATQLSAQRVRIDINKGKKHVTIDTRGRDAGSRKRDRDNEFRKPVRVKKPAGHFEIIRRRVWVPAHFEKREVRVYVPGKFIKVRERHTDYFGNVYYFNRLKFIAAHYKTVCKNVLVPGRFEIRRERVFVIDRPAHVEKGHGHHKHGGHGGPVTAPGHGGKGKKSGRNGRSRGNRGHGRH